MGAPQYEQAGADIGGTGTIDTIPRWTGASTLGDSLLSQSGTIVSAASAFRVQAGTNWATNNGGLLLFSNNGYKIGFDSVGSTVGYIRYQVDTAGSALHGHMFSAGALGSPTNLMFIRSDGNVGIGTASPGYRLDVANSTASAIARIVTTNAASSAQLILQGTSFGQIDNTVGDFFLTNSSAAGNMIFRTGSSTERMRVSASGTAAQSQVAIGTSSFTSGRALTTVADLDVFGVRVGRGNNGIASNTAIGSGTLAAISTAPNATAVGVNALAALTTGTNNTAIGLGAAAAATTSYNNTVVGVSALGTMTTNAGYQNVAVGVSALGAATSAKNNVAIGMSAGAALTSGSSNIIIGSGADVAATTDSNKLVIGDATNYVATNGGATTYYATAGALAGYIIVRLNGTDVKLPVYAL